MRRCVTLILTFFLILAALPGYAAAKGQETEWQAIQASDGSSVEICTYADGSYLEIVTSPTVITASNSVTRTKSMNHYGSSGVLVWTAKLTASFTYTGTSATCTSSNLTLDYYDSSYYTVSRSATKSGAKAIANFTIGRKVLGVPTSQSSYSLRLSCDKNGTVS